MWSEQPTMYMCYSKRMYHAFAPTKWSERAAGYDLRSYHECVVPKRGRAVIDLEIEIHVPKGCYGRIAPRSGLAAGHCIDVGGGVINEDYKGTIKVILINHGDTDFQVHYGDRIAQIICECICYPTLIERNISHDSMDGEIEMVQQQVHLKIIKLSVSAIMPTRHSDRTAGYDMYSPYECIVPKRSKIIIDTEIQMQLPTGCYGRIAPLFTLAAQHSIDVGAGVIDEDYRGPVKIILFNHGENDFQVHYGDKIAQLICQCICYPKLREHLQDDTCGA